MTTKAKVLIYDCETEPNLGYTWAKYEQNVIKFKREGGLLSVAWKWLGNKNVHVYSAQKGELPLVKKLHSLFDKADVIVAHNGNSFDKKKVFARFARYNMQPPSLFAQVDTKLIARSQFKFNSNSLNDLGAFLRLGKKLPHAGFDMWLGCMAGDKKAWKMMLDYNKQDVVLLEKVYLRLRPYANTHPNLALLNGERGSCGVCSSKNIVSNGVRATTKTLQQRWRCSDCGHGFTGGLAK